MRIKTPCSGSPCNTSRGTPPSLPKRSESESPKLNEDISGWTVDDVTNFVSGIDICAEYAQVRIFVFCLKKETNESVQILEALFILNLLWKKK